MGNIPVQSSSSVSSGVVSSSFQLQIDDLVEKITGLAAKNFLPRQKIEKLENQHEMNEATGARTSYKQRLSGNLQPRPLRPK